MERSTHAKLIVSGPMVDTYLKELGNLMLNKLSRGKITGIQATAPLLVPWQVMVNIIRLIKGYGGEVLAEQKKNKEKEITINILNESCSLKKGLASQKMWQEFSL